MSDKCSNCPREHKDGSVLCPWCEALYFSGQPVKGRGHMIQTNDGPPAGWVAPDNEQLELFQQSKES